MFDTKYNLDRALSDWAVTRLIGKKAHKLCRCRGFMPNDLEDLEQEMFLHLWQKETGFDPTRGSWRAWASFILDKWCIDKKRRRLASKRTSVREECSLNDLVEDEDGRLVQRYETTPEAAHDSFAHADLRHDLAALREQLPNDLKLVFDLFGKGGTVHSISIELGESRREIARRHQELLRHFIDAGLRDYL